MKFSAQVTALEQGVAGRDAECAQHLKQVPTHQQTVVRAHPAERWEYSRSDPARCWRVSEFDGDDDKLLAEYQQDIESGQPREGR